MSGVFVPNKLRFLFHSLQPEIWGRDSLEALMFLFTHPGGSPISECRQLLRSGRDHVKSKGRGSVWGRVVSGCSSANEDVGCLHRMKSQGCKFCPRKLKRGTEWWTRVAEGLGVGSYPEEAGQEAFSADAYLLFSTSAVTGWCEALSPSCWAHVIKAPSLWSLSGGDQIAL